MPAMVGNIALDCNDVMKVAAFWSDVLGRPLDDGASAAFASIGGTDGAREDTAWYFNRVPEPKQAKNRMHVDLFDPDYPAAVQALVRAGAMVVGQHRLRRGHAWTVMQDPEGNEFCIAAKPFIG